jgi:hypothetical protein
MKLACLLGRHEARASALRNQGLYFSACLHCERDMVRSLGHWQLVPKGFRVVWRGPGVRGPIAANLPVPMSPASVKRSATETRSRLAALVTMAGAALRALGWGLRDRLDEWRRHAQPRRPAAFLQLPTP